MNTSQVIVKNFIYFYSKTQIFIDRAVNILKLKHEVLFMLQNSVVLSYCVFYIKEYAKHFKNYLIEKKNLYKIVIF